MVYFQLFPEKILEIVFHVTKTETSSTFKQLQRIRDRLQKIAFPLKVKIQSEFIKVDLNILSIRSNITESLKHNLQCLFPLFGSNKGPKWVTVRIR